MPEFYAVLPMLLVSYVLSVLLVFGAAKTKTASRTPIARKSTGGGFERLGSCPMLNVGDTCFAKNLEPTASSGKSNCVLDCVRLRVCGDPSATFYFEWGR